MSLPENPTQLTPPLELDEANPQQTAYLKSLTPARVAQRRTGISIATSELLSFQLAHGRARDAVHAALQPASLLAEIQRLQPATPPILLHSAAPDRQTYLQRPDLGRKLSEISRQRLEELAIPPASDLAIVIADGLSALAVERNAAPLLAELLPHLAAENWNLAPISIVQQGRVAIGDEIAHAFRASLVVVLIGERPGLSSPDSLGAYITWAPRPGRTDAERNCISNIRSGGLDYRQAAARLLFYLNTARRLQLTGVALKETAALQAPNQEHHESA